MAKVQAAEYRNVYDKARKYVYPRLRSNPFYGPNTKKLKGDLAGSTAPASATSGSSR